MATDRVPVRYERRDDFLGGPTNGWYWRDEACEEWMGPFATLEDAKADYRELRATDTGAAS